jgi:hypothetical protein
MSRAISLNYEIQIEPGNPATYLYPSTIGEFSEGEEGRIAVADGDRKYMIRDQIYDMGEVPFTILLRKDRREYNLCQNWAKDGTIYESVYIVGRGAGKDEMSPADDNLSAASNREIVFVWELSNCELAIGKKSAFDRQSKAVDSKNYVLIPTEIEDISEQ